MGSLAEAVEGAVGGGGTEVLFLQAVLRVSVLGAGGARGVAAS